MTVTASFPAQVVAVVFRRAAVFQPQPGELPTFPGRVFRWAVQHPCADRLALSYSAIDDSFAVLADAPESVIPSDPRLAGDRVLAAMTARALVRALARTRDRAVGLGTNGGLDQDRAFASASASDLARDVDRDRALAFVLSSIHARVRDGAVGLDRDLVRATSELHMASKIAYDLHIAGELANELDRDLARSHDLGSELASEIDRDHALADAIALQLGRTGSLVHILAPGEIDASGADLSAGDFSDLSLLEDVIWTSQTVWPPGVAEQVERLSEEIAPGVYQVRRGTERDPSLVNS